MAYSDTVAFARIYADAKAAAVAEVGRRWWMDPSACLGRATFPAAVCASAKVAGTTIKSPNAGWLPDSRFWPGGSIPYATKMKVTPLDLSGQGETVEPPKTCIYRNRVYQEFV